MGGSSSSGSQSGSNYEFRKTNSGQGNWNTGGAVTGHGSMERGVVGINSNYDSAPRGANGAAPQADLMSIWQQLINGRNVHSAPNPAPVADGASSPPLINPAVATELLKKVQTRIPVVNRKQFYDRLSANDRLPGYSNVPGRTNR